MAAKKRKSVSEEPSAKRQKLNTNVKSAALFNKHKGNAGEYVRSKLKPKKGLEPKRKVQNASVKQNGQIKKATWKGANKSFQTKDTFQSKEIVLEFKHSKRKPVGTVCVKPTVHKSSKLLHSSTSAQTTQGFHNTVTKSSRDNLLSVTRSTSRANSTQAETTTPTSRFPSRLKSTANKKNVLQYRTSSARHSVPKSINITPLRILHLGNTSARIDSKRNRYLHVSKAVITFSPEAAQDINEKNERKRKDRLENDTVHKSPIRCGTHAAEKKHSDENHVKSRTAFYRNAKSDSVDSDKSSRNTKSPLKSNAGKKNVSVRKAVEGASELKPFNHREEQKGRRSERLRTCSGILQKRPIEDLSQVHQKHSPTKDLLHTVKIGKHAVSSKKGKQKGKANELSPRSSVQPKEIKHTIKKMSRCTVLKNKPKLNGDINHGKCVLKSKGSTKQCSHQDASETLSQPASKDFSQEFKKLLLKEKSKDTLNDEPKEKKLKVKRTEKMLKEKAAKQMLAEKMLTKKVPKGKGKMQKGKPKEKMLKEKPKENMLKGKSKEMLKEKLIDKVLVEKLTEKMMLKKASKQMLIEKPMEKILEEKLTETTLKGKPKEKLLKRKPKENILKEKPKEEKPKENLKKTPKEKLKKTKEKTIKARSKGSVILKDKVTSKKDVGTVLNKTLDNNKSAIVESICSPEPNLKFKRVSILELCQEIAGEIESDTVEVRKEIPDDVCTVEATKSAKDQLQQVKTETLKAAEDQDKQITPKKCFFPSKKSQFVKNTSPTIKHCKQKEIKLIKSNHLTRHNALHFATLPNLEFIRNNVQNLLNETKASTSDIDPIGTETGSLGTAGRLLTIQNKERYQTDNSPRREELCLQGVKLKEVLQTPGQLLVAQPARSQIPPLNTKEETSLQEIETIETSCDTRRPLKRAPDNGILEPALDESFSLRLDSSPEGSPKKVKKEPCPVKQTKLDIGDWDLEEITQVQPIPNLIPDQAPEQVEKRETSINHSAAAITTALPSDETLQKEIKKLKESQKDGDNQLVIDAGQKRFGAISCNVCGMLYTAANPEDETQHMLFHNQFVSAVKYVGWKKERILAEFPDGKIIMVFPDDPKYALKKVEEIREMVDNDLGFQQAPLRLHARTKTLLFISNEKKVIGCLIAEHIQWGYRVIDEKNVVNKSEREKAIFESQKAWCCSTSPEPALCGISRIWVFRVMRRQKIASRMIECLRSNFIYGWYLAKEEIAFSDPTPDGKQFATHYCGTGRFLVYNFISGQSAI